MTKGRSSEVCFDGYQPKAITAMPMAEMERKAVKTFVRVSLLVEKAIDNVLARTSEKIYKTLAKK